jgi:heme/copper-type cytochrome/quinol oxidase subunit 2
MAEAAIVVAALRMRIASNAPRGILGARPAEVMWTLLPLLLIAAMVLLSYQSHRDEVREEVAPAGVAAERSLT